jgi:hypothetical protein
LGEKLKDWTLPLLDLAEPLDPFLVTGDLVGEVVLVAVSRPQADRPVLGNRPVLLARLKEKEHDFRHAELDLLAAIQLALDLPRLSELDAEIRPLILDPGGYLTLPIRLVEWPILGATVEVDQDAGAEERNGCLDPRLDAIAGADAVSASWSPARSRYPTPRRAP